jgi:hypothetical protein
MNQNVRTTDAVTFATVDTGQGANELYAMNQNVRTTDAVTFATVDTGQGATEVHLMNQNVRTTDSVTFAGITGPLTGTATSATRLVDGGDLLTQAGDGTLIYTAQISNGVAGLFPAVDNSNTVITINRHPGNYYSQLGFSSNASMYYRSFSAAAINTSQAWRIVWDSGNDGAGSGLDADLWDGYQFSDYLNQAVRTTDSPTFNKVRVTSAGNSSGGNILMGPAGEGTNKWSYLTGTHFNATSQAQGVSLIGSYVNSTSNQVVIGGSIYEANPATEIQFFTHTANTHNLGGSQRMFINSSGNVVATVDMRAPIFYDSNDTFYQIDPNGNSRFVNLGLGGITPDVRLSVSGDIHVSNYIYQGGTAGSAGSWGSRTLVSSGNYVSNARSFRFDNVGYGSTWALDINSSGNVITNVDFRAPIFYDSADTGYRFNGDGTSVLNELTTFGSINMRNNYNTSQNLKLNLNDASAYGLVDFQLNGSHKGFFGLGGSSQSFGSYAAYAADGFSWNHDGSGKMIISARGPRVIDLNTGTESSSNFTTIRMVNQDVYITPDSNTGNLRSPLFYIQNDTTYLWNSNRIVVNQVTFPYREWDFSWGAHGSGSGTQSMSFRMWDNYTQGGAPSSYGTLIEYYGLSGHQHDQFYFYQGEILHRYGWYGTTNWQSGWRAMLHAGNYGSYAIPISGGINMTGSFGLNDQRLYLRTNGDTNHFIWNADDDWEEMRFFTGTGFRVQSSTGQVPATFTNSGINASNMTIGGAQVWYNSGGWHADLSSYGFTRYWGIAVAGGEFVLSYVSGQVYTLIDGSYIAGERGGFWSLENNNTWNSRVGFQNGGGIANFNSPVRINTNNNLYLDYNYGQSIVGVYTSTRYQGVFSMGDAYKPAIDGSNPGNLYGLAWSHPNAGGQAGFLNDHGLLVMNYGTTFAAISSRIWARDQMNAPIYYDRDTGYYGDFNSDTNWQGLTTYGKMRIGQTAKTNWRRNDYTGNSDYWVGTMGWGTRDFNEVMTWGSGFIDTWSNPSNQPSGTSHWVGVQAYHYTNAYNSAYGWQLVGGPIGNLRFRQSWPNAGGWTTVAMHDRNDGSGGALYAGIYYDSNDTSRYCDPNGFSYFSQTGLVLEVVKVGTGPNSRAFMAANNQGDNSWGIVGEFRVNGGPGGDRPSILFSSGFNSSTWSCGYGYADDSYFRINHDHGHRNQSWGTTDFYIDRGGNSYSNGSSRAPIFYDQNNTAYYTDPTGYSQMSSGQFNSSLNVRILNFTGVGGDSGVYGAPAYDIFQEGGGWGFPYPDLRIAYHTGIKLGANASYEGTRIYDDYPMGTLRYQFNGGGGYQYQYTWTQLTGHHGIYSGINGAHWYPNNSTYGSWRCDGSRNGYHGILIDSGNTPVLMFDGGGNGGIYYQSGRWMFYHYFPYNCVGVNTSATSPSYGMYVSRGIYATENIVAYSDRRAKENIVTIDSGLDRVLKMRGVFYNRIDDKTKKRQIGVIAQEVEEVLPEAVTYCDVNDEYGVAYGNLTGLLIEAVKDQNKIIEKQSDEIKELKEILNNLILNIKG